MYLKSYVKYSEEDQKHLGINCGRLVGMLIHYLDWPHIDFLNKFSICYWHAVLHQYHRRLFIVVNDLIIMQLSQNIRFDLYFGTRAIF